MYSHEQPPKCRSDGHPNSNAHKPVSRRDPNGSLLTSVDRACTRSTPHESSGELDCSITLGVHWTGPTVTRNECSTDRLAFKTICQNAKKNDQHMNIKKRAECSNMGAGGRLIQTLAPSVDQPCPDQSSYPFSSTAHSTRRPGPVLIIAEMFQCDRRFKCAGHLSVPGI